MTFFPFAASADFKAGTKSVGFSINRDVEISGYYFISENWAWLGGIGFQRDKHSSSDSYYNYSNEQKTYTFSTGVKYYFYKGDVNLFCEGSIGYSYGKVETSSISSSTGESYNTKGTSRSRSAGLNIGLEHFFSKQLSLGGTIGLSYYHTKSESGPYSGPYLYYPAATKIDGFKTVQTALKVNFYFN